MLKKSTNTKISQVQLSEIEKETIESLDFGTTTPVHLFEKQKKSTNLKERMALLQSECVELE